MSWFSLLGYGNVVEYANFREKFDAESKLEVFQKLIETTCGGLGLLKAIASKENTRILMVNYLNENLSDGKKAKYMSRPRPDWYNFILKWMYDIYGTSRISKGMISKIPLNCFKDIEIQPWVFLTVVFGNIFSYKMIKSLNLEKMKMQLPEFCTIVSKYPVIFRGVRTAKFTSKDTETVNVGDRIGHWFNIPDCNFDENKNQLFQIYDTQGLGVTNENQSILSKMMSPDIRLETFISNNLISILSQRQVSSIMIIYDSSDKDADGILSTFVSSLDDEKETSYTGNESDDESDDKLAKEFQNLNFSDTVKGGGFMLFNYCISNKILVFSIIILLLILFLVLNYEGFYFQQPATCKMNNLLYI
jgi:hypothetical protein